MKVLVIGLIVILLGIGGGGYYYFAVYQPSQFAEAFLAFAKEIENTPSEIAQTTLRGSYDFDGAIAVIERQRQVITQMKTRAESIQPPRMNKEMQRMQENLIAMFVLSLSEINDNDQRLLFSRKAINLFNILRPNSSTLRDVMPPPTTRSLPQTSPRTVGDILNYLGSSVFEEAKSAGAYLFEIEPPDLGGPSFAELKKAWEEALRGVAATTKYFLALDHNTLLSSLPAQSEIEKQIPDAIYAERMDDFADMLESVIIHNRPENLVSFPQSEEITRLSQQLGKDVAMLREKYQ